MTRLHANGARRPARQPGAMQATGGGMLWRACRGILLAVFWAAAGVATAAGIRDQTGRQVDVPADPRRVVALAPSITEIVFALEAQDRLAGVTRFSTFPPEARQLPQVGTYIHLDLERIAALQPDLCLAVKDGNPLAAIRRLEGMGIPVYAVDPQSLAAVGDAVLRIGALLGAADRGRCLAGEMERRIERVRERAAAVARRPRVFFQIGIQPIVAPGEGTFIHELIVTAGGRNLAAGRTGYPRFSRETVVALAPEVIVITSMNRGGLFDAMKAEWETWPHLPAVRDGRIHVVDSNLFDRPTPRTALALEQLFGLLHPDAAATESP